MIENDIMTELT